MLEQFTPDEILEVLGEQSRRWDAIAEAQRQAKAQRRRR